MLRRVHRESVVALSGPRALLMQAAHPSPSRASSPTPARSTSPTSGSPHGAGAWTRSASARRADADRATRRVRAMHAPRPRRHARAGRPLPGRDAVRAPTTPSCCCGSSPASPTPRSSSTRTTCARSARDERDAYWQDYRQVGRLFGLRDADMPAAIEDFDAYMAGMLRGRRPARDADGAGAGGPDRAQAAGAAEGPAAARAGQPDHRRPAARRPSAASTASLGSRARARAPRRRGVRQARARAAAARPAAAGARARGRRSSPLLGSDAPRARGRLAAKEGTTPHEGARECAT